MKCDSSLGHGWLGRLVFASVAGMGLSSAALVDTSHTLAAIVEYSAGHADIGVGYEDNELELHWHFGTNAVLDGVSGIDLELEPSEAYARLPDSRRTDFDSVPANLGFTGLTPGDPGSLWTLPVNSVSGVPFLGLATGELDPNDWIGGTTWSLQSAVMPLGGDFSLWTVSEFTSALGPLLTTADGIDATIDAFDIGIGTHGHFAWGFTSEGVYDITFGVSAQHATDGLKTDTGTFTFVVGSFTAIPEPGSAALLCFGATVTMCGVRRRRK